MLVQGTFQNSPKASPGPWEYFVTKFSHDYRSKLPSEPKIDHLHGAVANQKRAPQGGPPSRAYALTRSPVPTCSEVARPLIPRIQSARSIARCPLRLSHDLAGADPLRQIDRLWLLPFATLSGSPFKANPTPIT